MTLIFCHTIGHSHNCYHSCPLFCLSFFILPFILSLFIMHISVTIFASFCQWTHLWGMKSGEVEGGVGKDPADWKVKFIFWKKGQNMCFRHWKGRDSRKLSPWTRRTTEESRKRMCMGGGITEEREWRGEGVGLSSGDRADWEGGERTEGTLEGAGGDEGGLGANSVTNPSCQGLFLCTLSNLCLVIRWQCSAFQALRWIGWTKNLCTFGKLVHLARGSRCFNCN